MKIYRQCEIRTSIPWYMSCVCLPYIYVSTPPLLFYPAYMGLCPSLYVYPVSTCISTSMCLTHLYVSILTFTCLSHLYVSIPPACGYRTCMWLPHLYAYTSIYASTPYVSRFEHDVFENENTFCTCSVHNTCI